MLETRAEADKDVDEQKRVSEETIEHLNKMETALNNIVDPAVKEYLQLWKIKHDADIRFLCQSLTYTHRYLGQRIRHLAETTVVKETIVE